MTASADAAVDGGESATLTVKTLKQEVERIDVARACTLAQCKAALHAARPDWQPESLRLLCNGKVLREGTLAEQGVFEYLEGGAARFMVAMVGGKASSPKASSSKAASSTAQAAGGNASFLRAVEQRMRDTPIAAEATRRRPAAGWARPPPPPTVASPSQPSLSPTPVEAAARQAAAAAGDERASHMTSQVESLVQMGFPQAHAARALRAAGGDVGRAVELLTGAAQSPSSSGGGGGVRALGRQARAAQIADQLASNGAQLEALRRMPEVQQLLRLPRLAGIEDRPDELRRLLQRILLNPGLQEAMKRRQVTAQMLDEVLDSDPLPAASSRAERFAAMAQAQAAHRAEAQQRSAAAASGAARLEAQLSAADVAAVGRLQELGFARARALEAYLACDKDETLAANLLFDS